MSSVVVAKKRFGQNFLEDDSVLCKIVEAMPNSDRKIVEIGPGLGDLTRYLVDIRSVEAFEVDTDLCKHIREKFKDEIECGSLKLHCGDVLQSWNMGLIGEQYDLVANLPYYIATNIILKALADQNCCSLLVMVQHEVAQKFSASPGDRVFGSLSIIAQSVADVSIVTIVPPSAFNPPPKVDSAVLLIQKRASRVIDGFEKMLRVAFAQPRKTLSRNLLASYDKKDIADLLSMYGYKLTVRPHQMSVQDYHQLYTELETRKLRRDNE